MYETTGQGPMELVIPCDYDDQFRFKNGGAYREERGTVRCSNETAETAGATSPGAWTMRANGDSLIVTGVNGDGLVLRNKWKITELSAGKLTLKRVFVGTTATNTRTVYLEKK
ncbi:hypothetical protein LGH70_14340 [Hymenobacter sp. BT635]|uniref:Lipocalin-like domain-containing protein n=1 Tax=Hymenobacter nitidus TaxID=2880929 RepID=A0ABS8AGG1_9BACT|nr:hypothetical protein [Hymenobacter nitidus]MCB2378777.1 hypothetical protein [Hymenobacter nitidus]